MKASTSGLRGKPFPPSSPTELRRGLFTAESEEELDRRRLGVEDFLRELTLVWVAPLLEAISSQLTTQAVGRDEDGTYRVKEKQMGTVNSLHP